MSTPEEILRAAHHVVVQDYPSEDIPDALTRAGFTVTIYGGPNESDVLTSELSGSEVVRRNVGRYPEAADLLSTYRPLAELDTIVREAQRLGVTTIWRQPPVGADDDPDAAMWREGVEAAGLTYVDAPPIDELAKRIVA